MYLSVPVPPGTTVVDLQTCVRQFSEPEVLQESDRWCGAGATAIVGRTVGSADAHGHAHAHAPSARRAGERDRLCPHCKTHRRAAKRLELYRLPDYLIIHLKRFYFQGPWREKIDRPVAFSPR